MVYRVYVEKKKGLAHEAQMLKRDLQTVFGINTITKLRIINRYDAEGLEKDIFDRATLSIFAEVQLDDIMGELPCNDADYIFATEYLPGQFDQRADSAAQCIQMMSQQERPVVKSAKIYAFYGALSEEEKQTIKKYIINPVDSREASLDELETLKTEYDIPDSVATVTGFTEADDDDLAEMVKTYGFAMDKDDLLFCQNYFKNEEKRDPTVTELRVIDTYWSDHCRHTTFQTRITDISFDDDLLEKTYKEYLEIRKQIGRDSKPVTLMDLGTIAGRHLKATGELDKLDVSDEINACTVKMKVCVDGENQDWLLLFKNETHNHPTEIEPFGGAATCIGGAIRDPLSGRSYVYGAMRVTGGGDPTRPVSETLPGKLSQRKLLTTAAAGYSSYGNQIGLATGQVSEIYHEGYIAKHLEIGAVIGAVPASNVRRECPVAGDKVILMGGKTGRDGCGGATGSSKSHTQESLESCGAEVQKGNAPEERKLQRLFRNPEVEKMIKRCNDFGAGGVSVAVGELADGLLINLDVVPKKYAGLDGTELAISESQERMAVVVSAEDAEKMIKKANRENLEATVIAEVQAEPRLVMNWNGKAIVNITRAFLDSNGAPKQITIEAECPGKYDKKIPSDFEEGYKELLNDVNVCSQRGLSERFDSTIGAGSVLMPFGGKNQLTPVQAMVHKISVEKGHTDTCSYMSWGYNPFIASISPYHGAYYAVIESVSRLIATGASFEDVYLTFQEYFMKPMHDPKRWSQPLAALLGAFRAQEDLKVAAVGGKDSMSGSFEDIDVPPTLVSFAVTTGNAQEVVSPEFKGVGHKVLWLKPKYNKDGLVDKNSLINLYNTVTALMRDGKVLSAYTPSYGGIAEAVFKMAIGNKIGMEFDSGMSNEDIFGYSYGSFIIETVDDCLVPDGNYEVNTVGKTKEKYISYNGKDLCIKDMTKIYNNRLEGVYPVNVSADNDDFVPELKLTSKQIKCSASGITKPRVLIPVFPGTNCEYDTAKVLADAGAEPEIIVINNLSASDISESVKYVAERLKQSQILFIPGGFSGGDEPDGSGKFIAAFFSNNEIAEQVEELLYSRDGLACGICNGFQALIKLGLVPFGHIVKPEKDAPTLTYNTIGRHQSRLVRTRIVSNASPWLMETQPDDVFTVPISHGEGRFLATVAQIRKLAEKGQIATQYVDLDGNPTMDIDFNPNGSVCAVEGILSPDGRVLGKMGHSERTGDNLYRNVDGRYDMGLFRSAIKYFK